MVTLTTPELDTLKYVNNNTINIIFTFIFNLGKDSMIIIKLRIIVTKIKISILFTSSALIIANNIVSFTL